MLMTPLNKPLLHDDEILAAAHRAAQAIPPLWPLASSVAVNPFLGQTNEHLATAASRLRRTAGISLTMPRSWYLKKLQTGEMSDADLQAALDAAPSPVSAMPLAALKKSLATDQPRPISIPTVAELARDVSSIDWPAILSDRIGHWAAGYFDQGQALWSASQEQNAFASWRSVAIHDLSPEIAGLAGFAKVVADGPPNTRDALIEASFRLGLTGPATEQYFHRLLIGLGGWSQIARYRLWQAELEGGSDTSLLDLLAIRATWDAALLQRYEPLLKSPWQAAVTAHGEPVAATAEDGVDAVLQEAAERAAQRRLQGLIERPMGSTVKPDRPALQVAFCIDVRSEVFRRALEGLDAGIRTSGFAGFFGLGIRHRRFASDTPEARLPVLLSPRVFTCTGEPSDASTKDDGAKRISARAKRAWGRFRLAAISSFAFVEAAGPIYVGKLLRDSLGFARSPAPDQPAPYFAQEIDVETRVSMAAGILKAMSLTDGFARLVLLAGHGASVVNNPHASALNCGACGGYSGEVNARLLASLLNEPPVRAGLAAMGIFIPQDTLFLGALHDTTTDEVTVYSADHPSPSHGVDLDRARSWLAAAGRLARSERMPRLPGASLPEDVMRRARNWAELRPEWALAGCNAFIAAPRMRTTGKDLAGGAFLHDYEWRKDEGFGVLELILTAPVVVASWISLQYYGSTVAPEIFGAGNKLLHNVTGGIGVVEGNGGVLRTGLPWQSVHDGERLVHEPLRLSVLIEAPREAISEILDRHPPVRALFDNRWLHLFALDSDGRMAWRYAGDLRWESNLNELSQTSVEAA